MAFHFALEAVLHFRRSVEHQQELLLRAANQQVSRARHAIEQVDAQIGTVKSGGMRELEAGTTAAEMHFAFERQSALRQHRQQLLMELRRLQMARDQQQRVFQQARRERETFESLRDRQFAEYQRLAARRERRQLDDLFLLRRAYLRRS